MKISMSTIWDRTSEFLGDNLGAVVGIAGVAILIPTVISESLAPLKDTAGPGLKLGLGLLSLAFGLLSLWAQLALTALAIDPATGAAGARARAIARLGPMILVAIVLLLAALLLISPILVLLIANGVDPSQFGQPGAQTGLGVGATGFLVLYLLFVVVPVLIFVGARLLLTTAVVVGEGLTLAALGRSWRLTRVLTWRIIGVLLLYIIVMSVAMMAAVAVFGAIFNFLLPADGPVGVAGVLTALVSALVATIFSVIGAVFPAKLYLAARMRENSAREETAPA